MPLIRPPTQAGLKLHAPPGQTIPLRVPLEEKRVVQQNLAVAAHAHADQEGHLFHAVLQMHALKPEHRFQRPGGFQSAALDAAGQAAGAGRGAVGGFLHMAQAQHRNGPLKGCRFLQAAIHRQVVPGYSDLTNNEKLSKEAKKRQAGADKLWSFEAIEKDFLNVGKERMRALTVSIEETILQELNKTQTYQNARWAYLSNPRLRSTIVEVPVDEKGNRINQTEKPQLELPLVSKDDTREYKKDVMDLYRSRGKFAVSNGKDAENLKRLKTFAAARFDELLMPKLTLDADAKQSFYDAAEIPSPLDRVFIDGKPAKTFLKENLGYKADQITDDVLKAEIMGMATGGRNHVDIANAYSLGYDSNVRLQFAEVKLDLSGLDGLEHGYEKSRSARQNQLVRQDALKRHNYLDDLTLGWNKAKCKRARTEPVGKLIESNPEKYYEETGKTLVHAKELEQKRLENQKKRKDRTDG